MMDTLGEGNVLLADRAYDPDALRIEMAMRGVWANVRAMPNRKHVPPFNAALYKHRNAVERFFSKLKHFHAIATRYSKRDGNCLASVQHASIRIWLRFNKLVT